MELSEKLKIFAKEYEFDAFRDSGVDLRGWHAFELYFLSDASGDVMLTGYPCYALVRGEEIRLAEEREVLEIMDAKFAEEEGE